MKLFRTPWFLWCAGAGLAALALIWAAYRFSWPGTGFQGKMVWDWLQLLIVPAALALVALFFNQANTRTERQIALDKQREDLLQAYLDRMSELLLTGKLRTSEADSEVRNVARTCTISVLRQLDIRRVQDVFVFLREAGLAGAPNPVVSLSRADFSRVKWSGADLSNANLSGASLFRTNLSGAYLGNVDLSGAILILADLSKADLSEANLSNAILIQANLIEADLREATLKKATLKDAKIDKSRLIPEQIAQAIW